MANTESKTCPQCGAPIDAFAATCKFCGAEVAAQPQYTPPQAPQYVAQPAAQYAPPQGSQYVPPAYSSPDYFPRKSKTTAGLLGIFLGGLGVHKFYLGKTGMGILYLIFCWTYIPALIGFIEGIIYLSSSEEAFYHKYVKK